MVLLVSVPIAAVLAWWIIRKLPDWQFVTDYRHELERRVAAKQQARASKSNRQR